VEVVVVVEVMGVSRFWCVWRPDSRHVVEVVEVVVG